MGEMLRRYGLVLFLGIAIAGCSDDGSSLQITGPEAPKGEGRVYPITEVSFASNDGVQVSALFGALNGG